MSADGSKRNPTDHRRLAGRVTSATYIGSGLFAMAYVMLPISGRINRGPELIVASVPVAVGAIGWLLPWERWRWSAPLWLVALAFVLLGAANVYGATAYAGLFIVLIFAWVGVGYRRWTSLRFVPLAAAAYLAPALLGHRATAEEISSALMSIPLAVIIAEGIAWLSSRLHRTERALRESEQRYADAFRHERQVTAELRTLDEMKNTFLQAVSHELRTPLTVILGNALTLELGDSLSKEDARDLARRTAANARKLERLLADLLDLDRLQRGIVVAQPRPTDVTALARALIQESEFPPGVVAVKGGSVVAAVDPAKIERIVENLVVNAIKHSPPGTRVWVRVSEAEGGILLVVDDEGPGVPDGLKALIFQPFEQGPAGHPHATGTGIGLSLVARFAELHGGRAWVQDRPGGGASFRVFVPAIRPNSLKAGTGGAPGDAEAYGGPALDPGTIATTR